MTTVALWHLGVSGLLAGALGSVILVQSLSDVARRLSGRVHRPAPVRVQPRSTVEPRTVHAGARRHEESPAMASAAAAR